MRNPALLLILIVPLLLAFGCGSTPATQSVDTPALEGGEAAGAGECAILCPTQPGGCSAACPCEPVIVVEQGCTCIRMVPSC